MAEEQVEPQKGDWVRIWAQVTKASTEPGVHPEDLMVRLESHSEHYDGHIRLDRVVFKPNKVPDFVTRCVHLWHADDESVTFVRCQRHEGHGGIHRAESYGTVHTWEDKDSDGYIEER